MIWLIEAFFFATLIFSNSFFLVPSNGSCFVKKTKISSALTIVKTLSKIDPTDKTTVITVENKFLTEGIDKDRNVFEIIITIKCKAKIYNKHQENALINICNLITNSLIVSNNISAISKFDLRVGEIRDLNQVSSKKVDVDVNEYTNDSDFVPIEVDDVSQQLALRDIEIIK